jgi:hypothetical protein
MALVLTDSFPINMVLHGITTDDFEDGIKEHFIDCVSAWFGVSRSLVAEDLNVAFSGSVGVVFFLPLWDAGMQLICMRGDQINEFKLASTFKNMIKRLTHIDIFIGGLPVWSLSLTERDMLEKLAKSGYLWPSLLMDQTYHLGIIDSNILYCLGNTKETDKAIEFVERITDAHLQALRDLLPLNESHRELLDLSENTVPVETTHQTSKSAMKKRLPIRILGRNLGYTPLDTGSVSIYTSGSCRGILKAHHNGLLKFFEVKFNIPEERIKVESIEQMPKHLTSQAMKNKMVLLCEDFKTIAIKFSCQSLNKTAVTQALSGTLCQSLDVPLETVSVSEYVERDGSWVLLKISLDSLFQLLCLMTNPSQSTKLGKQLYRVVSEARGAHVYVGGLKSFPLIPICRLDGEWSHVTSAIAIPGNLGKMLLCRSFNVEVVDIETNDVREARGENIEALKCCSALVSIGSTIYAFGSRMFKVIYDITNTSFQCQTIGQERWSGTLAACRYRKSILVVKRKWYFYAIPQTDLYIVDTETGISQQLSKIDQPWSAVGGLVNIAETEREDNIVAICSSIWKLTIPDDSSRVSSTRLDQRGMGNFFNESLNCINDTLTSGGWQFTRSAIVHRSKLIVATGKEILPGLGGLFRVDPFHHGEWSAIHRGWHTIHTLVDVDGHLMAFTRNKLYEITIE